MADPHDELSILQHIFETAQGLGDMLPPGKHAMLAYLLQMSAIEARELARAKQRSQAATVAFLDRR